MHAFQSKKTHIHNNGLYIFYDAPDAFYGQLVDQQLVPINYLDDINYISGYPIFSIESIHDKKFLYRLFGIPYTWLLNTRRLCAKSIIKILNK